MNGTVERLRRAICSTARFSVTLIFSPLWTSPWRPASRWPSGPPPTELHRSADPVFWSSRGTGPPLRGTGRSPYLAVVKQVAEMRFFGFFKMVIEGGPFGQSLSRSVMVFHRWLRCEWAIFSPSERRTSPASLHMKTDFLLLADRQVEDESVWPCRATSWVRSFFLEPVQLCFERLCRRHLVTHFHKSPYHENAHFPLRPAAEYIRRHQGPMLTENERRFRRLSVKLDITICDFKFVTSSPAS